MQSHDCKALKSIVGGRLSFFKRLGHVEDGPSTRYNSEKPVENTNESQLMAAQGLIGLRCIA